MRKLYQLKLCPFSRAVRLVLLEKQLDHTLINEKYWEKRPGFVEMNPHGTLPVLVEPDGFTLSGSGAIVEYLDAGHPGISLLPGDAREKAQAREVCNFFDQLFWREVTGPFTYERAFKRFVEQRGPSSDQLRTSAQALGRHLLYIDRLATERSWLGGNHFSLADLVAAAHLSCLDYLGSISWARHEEAKTWYARVKSRPSFRSLLKDRHPGITPPHHYDDLDF